MALVKEFETQGNWLFKYRGQLPVLLLVVQLIYDYYRRDHLLNNEINHQWMLICLGVSILGQLIRFAVIGYTPRNTSGRNTKQQVAEVVNQTGIYSAVRHPLYLGNFFMWLGVAMISESLAFTFIFILIFWIFYERIMYAEEQFLTKTFGSAYTEWASRVPAFIPSFKNWKPSPNQFSLLNLLKRESVGIFNLFLVFYLFSLMASVKAGKGFDPSDPWLLVLGITTLVTLVLYVIRKKTRWLIVEGR
ncbi:MAG: DUF1295 domain-containing protein [Bacteroidetes bacterium]|nr:DUF1295 domain-containing protein [Bacteroidota bacterium]